MLKRVSTSVVLVVVTAIFILLRFVDVRLFNIYVLIMAILGSYELLRAFKKDVSIGQKICVLASVLLTFIVAVFFIDYLVKSIVITTVIIVLYTAIENKGDSLKSLGYVIISAFYPTIPLLSLVFINNFENYSFYLILTVFTTSWFTDVGGYLIGSTFKGPKLCPKISPNKTISGAFGGIIGGVLATFTSYYSNLAFGLDIFSGINPVYVVLFLIGSGVFLSVITQLGDIFESFIKRRLEIKDMGNLLPGHGGILDRIDGLTFNCLLTWILYSFLI